jgi:hypothetical protein
LTNYEYLEEVKKYGKENKIPIILDDTLDYINNILIKIFGRFLLNRRIITLNSPPDKIEFNFGYLLLTMAIL